MAAKKLTEQQYLIENILSKDINDINNITDVIKKLNSFKEKVFDIDYSSTTYILETVKSNSSIYPLAVSDELSECNPIHLLMGMDIMFEYIKSFLLLYVCYYHLLQQLENNANLKRNFKDVLQKIDEVFKETDTQHSVTYLNDLLEDALGKNKVKMKFLSNKQVYFLLMVEFVERDEIIMNKFPHSSKDPDEFKEHVQNYLFDMKKVILREIMSDDAF